MSRRNRGILLQSCGRLYLVTKTGGKVSRVEIDCSSIENRLTSISNALAASPKRYDLTIATSAANTLATSIQTIGLPTGRRMRREAMSFAMEEYLPWSFEEFTASFTMMDDCLFGVAIRTAEWAHLVQKLRREGHAIATITPAAMLLLEASDTESNSGPDAGFLLRDQEGVHYVRKAQGKIVDWRFWVSEGADELQLGTSMIASEICISHGPHTVHLSESAASLAASMDKAGQQTCVMPTGDAPTDDLIWRGAERIWKSKEDPLNLAVNDLAGETSVDAFVQSARVCLVASTLVLLSAALAFWWKGQQLGRVISDAQQEQVEIYRAAFPGSTVPLAVPSRLDSKYREIVGARGGAEQVKFPQSVLTGLSSVLSAHKAPIRSQFQEISINDDVVEIECEFRTRDDASRMVQKLTECGLSVEPPQLQKLDQRRIGTRLRGRLADAAREVD